MRSTKPRGAGKTSGPVVEWRIRNAEWESPVHWNIADLFEAQVDLNPEREALVCGPKRRSYAELEARSNRLAHALGRAGVGRGDHVGVYAYNSPEWVESAIACYKLRAVPININYRYVEGELRYLFDNADLVAVIHGREFAPRIAAIRAALPRLRHAIAIDDGSAAGPAGADSDGYEEALAAESPSRDFAPRSGDDLYILYTGGTTGMPKGVMWRQEDVVMALGGGIPHDTGVPLGQPEELVGKARAMPPLSMFPVPPLMHGAGQWGLWGGLFVGSKVVLYGERRFDPERVWRIVEEERVVSLNLTGDAMGRPLVEALAAHPEAYDLSSLLVVASTAAVLSPSVRAQLQELLPRAIVTEAIGSTETGFGGATVYQADTIAASAGGPRVSPGRGTGVIDEEGKPLAPGSGKIGRLVRSGNIPLGYYGDEQKTRETFVTIDGVRYAIPGDSARVEADGTITLLGRDSVCINTGGEKVYAEEVEAVLKAHPDVFDAVVVGVPDPRWGQKVAAVVQPRPGVVPTLESVDAHCRQHVAAYKVPRALVLVGQLQRHPSGKPDYPWARHLATND
jgi:acyl-CoA synthetase (AMP-forming)/AMP-acid ligase II